MTITLQDLADDDWLKGYTEMLFTAESHEEVFLSVKNLLSVQSGELQRLAELAEDGLKWRREQEQVQKLADKFEKDQDRCPREGIAMTCEHKWIELRDLALSAKEYKEKYLLLSAQYVRDVEALETERDAMREAIQKYLKERGDPSWWDAGMRRLEQSLNPKNEEGKS